MVISDKERETISRMIGALQHAQEETDMLPVNLPGPLKDRAFDFIVTTLLSGPDSSYTCPSCSNLALSMALSALGWEDRAAPRPASPKERMDALIDQMKIAWEFLDGIRHGEKCCGHE